MKIVAFSDLHGQYSKALDKWFSDNPADILCFAGDLQLNHSDDGKKFIEWLSKLPYKHKIITLGNHDGNYEYILDYASKYDDIHVLINQSITIDDIKFFGSPNSVQFLDWFFMGSEKQLEEIYSKIPDDTDVLITHTPPFSILDYLDARGCQGSLSLFNRVQQLKNLKYHLFAHIHEHGGKWSVKGNTKFYNCSILDEKYKFVNMPIIFEYEENKDNG